MKRFLSLLLCLLLLVSLAPALAEGADVQAASMPDEVKKFFSSSQFNGCTIGAASACVIEHSAGRACFAVVQKDGRNTLYGFEYKNNRYNYWLKTDGCLPQGEGGFSLLPMQRDGRYMVFPLSLKEDHGEFYILKAKPDIRKIILISAAALIIVLFLLIQLFRRARNRRMLKKTLR